MYAAAKVAAAATPATILTDLANTDDMILFCYVCLGTVVVDSANRINYPYISRVQEVNLLLYLWNISLCDDNFMLYWCEDWLCMLLLIEHTRGVENWIQTRGGFFVESDSDGNGKRLLQFRIRSFLLLLLTLRWNTRRSFLWTTNKAITAVSISTRKIPPITTLSLLLIYTSCFQEWCAYCVKIAGGHTHFDEQEDQRHQFVL